MDRLTPFVFGAYALLILFGGLFAAASRDLVRAFVGLLVSFAGVAGMYFLMNAPFVAFMQVLVYICAVSVIVFLAVMVTVESREGRNMPPKPLRRRLAAVLSGGLMVLMLSGMVLKHPLQSLAKAKAVSMAELGRELMGTYGLAFELISVILFVAMLGAMVLVHERRKG